MIDFKKKFNKSEAHKSGQSQNPKILEVNLVKNEKQISFDWNKKIFILSIVLFVALAVVLEIYFGLIWWQAQEEARIKALDDEVFKINVQVEDLKNKESDALNYKAKSAAFSSLLDGHIYWSNFFDWVEKNTLNTVKYLNFQGDLSGSYSLEATTQTYADVSWQVKSFLNDKNTVRAAVAEAAFVKDSDKTKPNQINFTLSLQIKPTIFKKIW